MGKCPPHQISRTRCLKNWSLRASRIALLILLSKIASMVPPCGFVHLNGTFVTALQEKRKAE